MKLRKKLKGQKGFSMMEMLACTVVLLLLAMVLNVGLQAALDSYHRMIAKSETQILVSTAIDALADELRYTQYPENYECDLPNTGGGTPGENNTIELREGRIYVPEYKGLDNGSAIWERRRLLPGGPYGNGAYIISELKVTYDPDAGSFTIEITARETNGTISSSAVTSVRCLNGQKA